MSAADLERELRELGDHLDYPAAPAMAWHVRSRLLRTRDPRPTRLRTVSVLAAALLTVTGAAVAVRFAVPGVELRVSPLPAPASRSPAPYPDFGLATSLPQAEGAVDFPVAVPSALGVPDHVWVGAVPSGGRVTLGYGPRPGLPRSPGTRLGALITQFRASIDDPFLVKETGPGTVVERLVIGGEPAFWIEGDPHAVVFLDRNGRMSADEVRLAGNVLLWQRGGVTLRLEADVGRARALEIANSIP